MKKGGFMVETDKQIDEAVNKHLEEAHVKPNQLLSQSQLAQASGFSNATVSRYLKKKHIQGIKSKRGREILYHRDVLEQLLGYHKEQLQTRKQHPQRSIAGALEVQLKQALSQINSLQEQLKTKDQQIETKDKQIAQQQHLNDDLAEQNKNLQELLVSNQEVLKQNQSIIDKNTKLVELQNELLKDAKGEPKSNGFWSKLFK